MTEKPSNYVYLMSAVGSTLGAWSQVENGLGLLFYTVSDIPNMHKAGAIIDAVVAFEARLAIIDAAMEHEEALSDANKILWTSLSARLRKLYKKRHEIAHFSVRGPNMADATEISPYFTWNRHATNTAKSLTLQQIMERSGKFSDASAAVSWFEVGIRRRKHGAGADPRSPEEPPLIVHIREQLAQNPAKPPRPPRSSRA